MVSEEPTDGRCNAPAWLPGDKDAPKGERSKTGFCEAYPMNDEDGEPRNGKCATHGGKNPGAPEGNQNAVGEHDLEQDGNTNAMEHGLYSGRTSGDLYPALDPADREFVDDLVLKYREFGGWSEDDPRVERLISVCVDIWREARAKGVLVEEGPSEEQVIGTDPNTGEPIIVTSPHHLQGPVANINQTVRMNLKDMDLSADEAGSESAIADGLTVNVNVIEYDGETETEAEYVDSTAE